jgi:hypothetical protein
MIVFSRGITSSYLTLSIFILGLMIGLYALLHNKIGNFNIRPDMKEEKFGVIKTLNT